MANCNEEMFTSAKKSLVTRRKNLNGSFANSSSGLEDKKKSTKKIVSSRFVNVCFLLLFFMLLQVR